MRARPFVTAGIARPPHPAGRDRLHRRAGAVAGARDRGLSYRATDPPATWERRCPTPETPTRRRSRRSGNWPTISPPAASRAAQFRIGTEHEKFGFRLADLATPALRAGRTASPADPRPAAGLAGQCGGTPILDDGNPIGLKQGDAAVSLEPAGQLELSGARVETLHDTMAELAGALRPGAQRSPARSADRLCAARLPPDRRRASRCRGCRRAATPSCGATCRRWARSAST